MADEFSGCAAELLAVTCLTCLRPAAGGLFHRPRRGANLNKRVWKERSEMRKLLSVLLSVLMLSVQTVSGVAAQPGTPLPTVDELDAAVAERALIDHFRRSGGGRMDELKLATLQYLNSIEDLSQEDLIAFGRELSGSLEAQNPPTETADSPTIELGLTVNPSFLGPVGVRISVDQKVTKLLGALVPDFVRSPSEPAVSAVARTPLNEGVLEMAALRETYDLWLDRRADMPLEMELRSQEVTAAIDRKLFVESAAYRAARPEFINVAFEPTDTADAVLEAVPAFADSETGAQVAAELQALRAEIEAGAVTDERIEGLQRLMLDTANRTYDLHEQVIEVIGESLAREYEEERRDSALQARLKIQQTDTENAMTVFGVTASVLFRFAPRRGQGAGAGRDDGRQRLRGGCQGSAPLPRDPGRRLVDAGPPRARWKYHRGRILDGRFTSGNVVAPRADPRADREVA